MTLKHVREEIDRTDSQLIRLLARRAELSRTVGRMKASAGLPIEDRERERQVLRRSGAILGESDEAVSAVRIYEQILTESRELQRRERAEMLADAEASR